MPSTASATSTTSSAVRHGVLAAVLDVVAVLAFVIIGRDEHDEESSLAGIVDTAAPFVIGLLVAWLVARAWRRPFDVRIGLLVVAVTVAVGMIVRAVAFDDGTAATFIVVTTIFLGVTMVGWRFVATRLAARRAIG